MQSFPGMDKYQIKKAKKVRTEAIKETATKHSIALSGKYMGNQEILVRADFKVEQKTRMVVVQLRVRSDELHCCEYIHNTVAGFIV